MSERPMIETRSAGAILDVRFPDRVIELLAVPYDEEAIVEHRGRAVRERISPGAFAGVEVRASKDRKGNVKVNLAHDRERVIGRAIALRPEDPRGLVAEIRISNTAAGNDALELAADELLDASVGFYPLPGGEVYSPDRTKRTITRAYLDHIALTADPAYTEAKVLSVRRARELELVATPRAPTPRLDAILLERRLVGFGLDETST
jgi:HK97 family phage prohead protease